MNYPLLRCAVLCAAASIFAFSCKSPEPPPPAITDSYSEEFERDELGSDWRPTARDAYQLTNGSLRAMGAFNHPLWLKRRLPDAAVIELDAWSQSIAGDIKVELYGDGKSFDPDKGSYLSTGYVLVMGGWNNSKSMIARLDEHGDQVATRTGPKVEVGRRYHWKIVRAGSSIQWFVDDMNTPFLQFSDPSPLGGDTHGYFGFNNWESDVGFDNLVIRKTAP